MRLALDRQTAHAHHLLSELAPEVGHELADAILTAENRTEAGIAEQRERVAVLKAALAGIGGERAPIARDLETLADDLVRRSVWIVGGDGWAYDIGSGGLDHVLASGWDVNILVLDTEVYSNTGGQASKSTPRGALAKFAARGKPTEKKNLGLMATTYGNVYVAQVAMGANDMQTVRAMLEAEAWDGPSIVIAYSTCIAHGIDMAASMSHQRDAVRSGHWPLFRFDPGVEDHEHPFHLDAKAPSMSIEEFAATEARFSLLARSDPDGHRKLMDLAQEDARERRRYHEQLVGVERTAPALPEHEGDERHGPMTGADDEGGAP
jgi:pyruvate-ferredoxin/flavodoxin oxidoreductase